MKARYFLVLFLFFFSNHALAFELGNFKVLSNNHVSGKTGMYFNFNRADVDRIMGGTGWNNIRIVARNHGIGKTSTVVLWRSKNGGNHNAHGRWDKGAAINQWRVGDRISLYAKGSFKVLSTNHASNIDGKYFNFSVDKVDRVIGNTSWHNKRFKALVNRKIGTVVLWRTRNGGGGNGHGRWDPVSLAKPNQWRAGDNVILF